MSAFTNASLDYHAMGIVPLPVKSKRPKVSGFNNWRGISKQTVERFNTNFPDADIGILTKLSELLVVDIDSKDLSLYSWVIDEFGWTPLCVETNNGFHLYYSNKAQIRGRIGDGSYPIDLKGYGASDYVVAPPTQGYEFLDVFLDEKPANFGQRSLKDFINLTQGQLPEIKSDGLKTFFPNHPDISKTIIPADNKACQSAVQIAPKTPSEARTKRFSVVMNDEPILEGRRNKTLWERGMTLAAKIGKSMGHTDRGLHELRRRLDELNSENCAPPLPPYEVDQIAKSAWKYELKGKNFFHKNHKDNMTNTIVTVEGILLSLEKPKPFALLNWLKSHYDDDAQFLLNDNGLMEALGWSKHSVRVASVYLRKHGFVEQVLKSNWRKRISAEYIFTDKSNTIIFRAYSDLASNDNRSEYLSPTG